MSRQRQIDLVKRLLHCVDTKTTALADAPWRNDVSVYADPQHLAREQQILFRQHPILMGFGRSRAHSAPMNIPVCRSLLSAAVTADYAPS